MPLSCQKSAFYLPDDVHYLNCAYMSPLLKSAEAAGIKGMQSKRLPYLVSPDDFFTETNELKKAFAKLINTQEHQSIAIIPSVSYGMAIVAKNLSPKKNQKIIIADEQFPSNVYPWLELQKEFGTKIEMVKPPQTTTNRAKLWNEALLEAIDQDTLMVALPNVHWADGSLFNLKAIRKRTKEVGAYLVVDGTQSVGALPFNVQDIAPDALICAGYKWLMGPYSLGLAYFGPNFRNGKPIEENWKNRMNSHNFSELVNYQPAYQEGSVRFDVGESSNFILVPMLKEAINQLLSWNPENILQYCRELCSPSIKELQDAGFIIEHHDYLSPHLFGIRLPNAAAVSNLAEKLKENKVYVSVRGNAIRVSPHVYNTAADLNLFSEILLHHLKTMNV